MWLFFAIIAVASVVSLVSFEVLVRMWGKSKLSKIRVVLDSISCWVLSPFCRMFKLFCGLFVWSLDWKKNKNFDLTKKYQALNTFVCSKSLVKTWLYFSPKNTIYSRVHFCGLWTRISLIIMQKIGAQVQEWLNFGLISVWYFAWL